MPAKIKKRHVKTEALQALPWATPRHTWAHGAGAGAAGKALL